MSKPPKQSGAAEDEGATRHKIETGARLLRAIEARGKKQKEVAEEFGVSASRLGHWIRGLYYPDIFFLVRFCKQYGVTMDWIFREEMAGVPVSVADALSQQKPASGEGAQEGARRVPEKTS